MPADPAQRRATYQDVLDAPENMVAEIIDGELILNPRPAKPLNEPELHLGPDVIVPDLAGWRREQMPVMTDDVPYCELAPDWAAEVLMSGGHYLLVGTYADAERVRAEPFDAIELDLSVLWADVQL